MTVKYLKKPVQCRTCGYAFLPQDRESLPRDCPKCGKVMWYIIEEVNKTVLTKKFRERVMEYFFSYGMCITEEERHRLYPEHEMLHKHIDRVFEAEGILTDEQIANIK